MAHEHRRRRRRGKPGPDTTGWTEADHADHRRRELLATPVAEMALPVRVINTLEEHGVILCVDLVKQTYTSMMSMANFGERTLEEVRAAVTALGLEPPAWKKPPPDDEALVKSW